MKKKMFKTIFILFFSGVFLFSTYMLVSALIDYKKGDEVYADLREFYTTPEASEPMPSFSPIPGTSPLPMVFPSPVPTQDPLEEPVIGPTPDPLENYAEKFQPLMDINPDFVGWLAIPGTGISYPVVQRDDNDYYLKHLFTGESNIKGSIYMDFRNDLQNADNQYLIYGHNMRDGSMFAELNRYSADATKNEYFRDHSLIVFDTIYGEMKFEVFSSYVVKLNQETYRTRVRYDEDAYVEFLDSLLKRSLVKKPVELSKDSIIITLVTCSPWYDNSRTLVHAVLVD